MTGKTFGIICTPKGITYPKK